MGLLTRLGCVQGLVLLIFLFLYVWLGPPRLWHTGLVILWHAETSWTGDCARIPELAGGYFKKNISLFHSMYLAVMRLSCGPKDPRGATQAVSLQRRPPSVRRAQRSQRISHGGRSLTGD